MLILRRLRGIAVSALTWAVLWGMLGASAYVVISLVAGSSGPRPALDVGYLAGLFGTGFRFFGSIGAIAGGLFATAVSLGERRRTFATLRPRRMVLWGALGGAALPVLSGLGGLYFGVADAARELVLGGIGSVLGAGSAWALLRIAVHSPQRAVVGVSPIESAALESGHRWESSGAGASPASDPLRARAT